MRFFQGILVVSFAALIGCGGGGGSSIAGGGGGPAPAPEAAPVGSAKFTVDARTGEVKVEPISASRAAFSGGALSFTSSLLLSEGSPERRIIRVTAKNNTQETIGASGSFRVLFTNFQNANTPLTDLRSLVQTSTVWGNGTASTTTGGLSTASINGPSSVDYYEADDSIFAVDNATTPYQAKQGTVSRYNSATGFSGGIAVGPGFALLATSDSFYIRLDDGSLTLLAGGVPGTVDGPFASARFQDIKDFHIIRATGPDDFEAVVADTTLVRRIERTAEFPSGRVLSLYGSSSTIKGVTIKDGTYYFTAGNSVFARNASGQNEIGLSATSGFVDGAQAGARFNNPNDLRWVGNSLFVADSGNNRIRQLNLRPGGSPISPNNWWVSTISGNGTASGVDGTGTFMTHNNPVSLVKGPGETLIVADRTGNRIRRITPISNRFLENFGDSTANPTEQVQLANATDYVPSSPTRTPLILEDKSIPAGGSVTLGEWQFNLPEGVKSFSFIVTVEADTLAPGVLPSVSNTGSGTKGSTLVSLRTLTGSTGPGSADGSYAASAFDITQGICVTESGDIFVSDFNNSSIRRISRSGVVSTILGPAASGLTTDGEWPVSSAFWPVGIACTPDGSRVYFTQFRCVRMLEFLGGNPELPQSWRTTTIAGDPDEIGNVMNTTGDAARFGFVFGVAVVNSRTVVATDANNHCVFTVERRGAGASAADYFVKRLAGSEVGLSGYLDGGGSGVRFSSPAGITLASNGQLFVVEFGNRRIRKLDLGGVTTTHAGSGAVGSTDSTNPLGATFTNPRGIAAEPSGYLYVADPGSKQIRRIAPSGVVTTVAGTATVSGTADGTGNTGTFLSPEFVAVGPGGDVYVTDLHRIRLLQRIITN